MLYGLYPQETADLVTFTTEEILNGILYFFAVVCLSIINFFAQLCNSCLHNKKNKIQWCRFMNFLMFSGCNGK